MWPIFSCIPGAAVEPAGDVITADIARESVNEVIKELKALDVQHRGAITLQPLDTVLSTRAHEAEDAAEGDSADAVVWDELIARTREDATLTVTFLMFLTLACLIAAIGAVNDSTVTVVGAMVLGPEFGPLAALSVALVQRRLDLARRAAIALLVGFPVAMGITAAGRPCRAAAGWLSVDSVLNVHEVDFIFRVGPLSFVGRPAGRGRRNAVAGVGEIRRSGGRVHLGDDGAGRRVRGRRGDSSGTGGWRPSRRHSLRSICSASWLPGCWCWFCSPRGSIIPRSAQT